MSKNENEIIKARIVMKSGACINFEATDISIVENLITEVSKTGDRLVVFDKRFSPNGICAFAADDVSCVEIL